VSIDLGGKILVSFHTARKQPFPSPVWSTGANPAACAPMS
jgi:hypothetical protein